MSLDDNFDANGEPVTSPTARLTAVALCLVAATLLTAACLSKRWLANGSGPDSIAYGLIRHTECIDGACATRGNDLAPEALRKRHPPEELSPAFPVAGWVALGASALAIVALATCGLLGLFRRRLALPIAPSSLALFGLLVAMVGGAVFIATKPGGLGRVGVDWGFVVFSAAIVIGMVAAQRISKEIRPIDHELELLEQMNRQLGG
jgi:hypothetical protein